MLHGPAASPAESGGTLRAADRPCMPSCQHGLQLHARCQPQQADLSGGSEKVHAGSMCTLLLVRPSALRVSSSGLHAQ